MKRKMDLLSAITIICVTVVVGLVTMRGDFEGIDVHIGNSELKICTRPV